MYLFVRDVTIVGFALNKRMALVGETLVADGALSENPYPGSILHYIPDQKRGWMFEEGINGERRTDLKWPDGVPTLPSSADLSAQVDYETQCSINLQTHVKAYNGEQIGILRDQIVQWGNKLGLEFTEDFARLNEIAIAAIKEGATKKAALGL